MLKLLCTFFLLSTLSACGDKNQFADDTEFAQFIVSLNLENLTLNEAKEKLASNGFKCYEKGSSFCIRELPGLLCLQSQLVSLTVEKNKTSLLIRPKLNRICL